MVRTAGRVRARSPGCGRAGHPVDSREARHPARIQEATMIRTKSLALAISGGLITCAAAGAITATSSDAAPSTASTATTIRFNDKTLNMRVLAEDIYVTSGAD